MTSIAPTPAGRASKARGFQSVRRSQAGTFRGRDVGGDRQGWILAGVTPAWNKIEAASSRRGVIATCVLCARAADKLGQRRPSGY